MRLIHASVLLLILALQSVQPQVATKVWSSHVICPQTTDGRISTFASNGSTLVTMACSLGPIVSHNAGRTFRAYMSPAEASSLQYAPSVGWLCANVILVAGVDNAFGSEGTAYRSDDGGVQWTPYSRTALQGMKFKGVSGFDSWILQHNGTAKFHKLYTTDCGDTWMSIPVPDSLVRPNNITVFQLRDGTFAVRSNAPSQWYMVDYASRSYQQHWLPNVIARVYRLSDSTLFGIATSRASHSFYRSSKTDSSLLPFIIRTSDTLQIDSTFVGETTQLCGGAVVVSCADAPKELIIVHGQTQYSLHQDSFLLPSRSWGRIVELDSSTFVVNLSLLNNKLARVLVNVDSKIAVVLPSSFATIQPDLLSYKEGVATAFVEGGRVLNLSPKTGEVTIGGMIDDPYDRATAIPIEKIVVVGNARFSFDRLGDVGEFASDTTCILRGRAVERLVHLAVDDNINRYRQFLFGHALVWNAGNGVVVGGTSSTFIRPGIADTLLFSDTTTFFTQGASGRAYVGFRRPFVRRENGQPFTPLGSIGDGRATLTALVEAGPGVLIAGKRGYVMDSDGQVQDTVVGGIWTSFNDGVSWSESALPDGCDFVYSLGYRSVDSTLWASCSHATVLASSVELNELHLIRSTDLGRTWTTMQSVPYHGPWLASECNVAFSVHGLISWTARDRILTSSDGGGTWDLLEGLPQTPHAISSAVFSEDGMLHIATSNGYYRYESTVGASSTVEMQSLTELQIHALVFPQPANATSTLQLEHAEAIAGLGCTIRVVDNCGVCIAHVDVVLPQATVAGSVSVPIELSSLAAGVYGITGSTRLGGFHAMFVRVQ